MQRERLNINNNISRSKDRKDLNTTFNMTFATVRQEPRKSSVYPKYFSIPPADAELDPKSGQATTAPEAAPRPSPAKIKEQKSEEQFIKNQERKLRRIKYVIVEKSQYQHYKQL